jgi:mRNA interferase MazF
VIGSALACSLPNGLVIVIPTTTTAFPVPYRVEVALDPGRTSYAMCEQVKSISVERLETLHRCRTIAGPDRLAVQFAVQQMLF